jgi:nicotinamidase-related amidase
VHGADYFARHLEFVKAARASDRIFFTDWRSDSDERLTDAGPTIGELLCEAARRGSPAGANGPLASPLRTAHAGGRMEVGSYGSCSPTLQARARQAMSDNLSLDPKTTAVVLIEYQNDFTSDGGALHGAVADVMDSTGMLDNTVRLVAAARAAGATIMHAPITFATGYNEISAHPYGILKGVVDGNAFVKDSWGAAIVDVLAPQSGDIVVEGKRGLDTFASTNLDFILRSKGITTIVLGGFLTNCCVESTMRTGYENGYRVFTLKDCVAATSQAEHDNAITYDFPMFSLPVSAETVIAALSPSASDAA